MEFPLSEKSFEVGGFVTIPHSLMGGAPRGQIVNVTKVGISVVHKDAQESVFRGFYSYDWLNHQYGPPNDPVPDLAR
jgi:hypothetical protein